MPFEIAMLFVPILAILTGMVSIVLKHREKMAGLGGKQGGQTVQLLTETLEKEHERIAQLQRRVETLEAIVTDERTGPAPRIALPDADADPDASAAAPRRVRS